jgi:hypothetical protein
LALWVSTRKCVFRVRVAGLAAWFLPKLSSFNEHDIANTAWALAKLGHKDEAFMSALLTEAKPKLGGFTAQAMANTAWAVAKLGYKDAPFMRALLVAMKPKLSTFDRQNLSNTVWALATLDYNDAAFMRAVLAASTLKIASSDAQNLSNTIDVRQMETSLGKLYIKDAEFERALATRSAQLGGGK